MSDEPKYRDEEWLREQYVERRRTKKEIADSCGCSRRTIKRHLDNVGIETRPGRPTPDKRLKSEGWLRKQYVERARSSYDIAEDCGCSAKTVRNWLERNNITVRDGTFPQGRLKKKNYLKTEYKQRGRSAADIADELKCSTSTVYNWLKRHGIQTRGFCGPENSQWEDGSRSYGRGWNASKRRAVRERDGHTCQDPACSVTQDDHLAQYGEKLHVHHLIKARDIDDPEERNAPENLITLCRDCHREWEQLSEAGIRPQIDGVTAD